MFMSEMPNPDLNLFLSTRQDPNLHHMGLGEIRQGKYNGSLHVFGASNVL